MTDPLARINQAPDNLAIPPAGTSAPATVNSEISGYEDPNLYPYHTGLSHFPALTAQRAESEAY